MHYIVYRENPSLLGVWIFIIVLIALIGALMRKPPETLYQRFDYDSSKVQYITIGGATNQNVSTNS
jgi:hypothetical protein